MHDVVIKSHLEGLANDATCGFIGFALGNIYAILWNYQARKYVRDRLSSEKEIGFSRKQFLQYHNDELLSDYKLLSQYSPNLLSDADLEEMRKLYSDDKTKVNTLKEIHREFAKDAPIERPHPNEPEHESEAPQQHMETGLKFDSDDEC